MSKNSPFLQKITVDNSEEKQFHRLDFQMTETKGWGPGAGIPVFSGSRSALSTLQGPRGCGGFQSRDEEPPPRSPLPAPADQTRVTSRPVCYNQPNLESDSAETRLDYTERW